MRPMLWILARLAAVTTLALAAGQARAAESYAVTDLGTLGGDASEASAINNAGQVVGWSTTAAGATHAFLHAGGAITDLGTLTGGSDSVATGINERGQVVGHGGINAYGPQFREVRQGFLWQGGAMQPLGALYCPCTFNQRYGASAAYAIDGAGQVVGDSGTVRGETVRHAFSWRDGVMQDVGGGAASPTVSFAYAADASGKVAGSVDGRAALWLGGVSQDLGVLPGHGSSAARGVNAAGLVVGESSSAPSASRAFAWQAGTMRDLGTLPGDGSSRANGVNGSGQIVGWSRSADGSTSRAVLWQGGAIIDLNSLLPPGSGWTLTSAAAINDRGQIAGTGVRDGHVRAFVLIPASPVAMVSSVLPQSRSVQVGATATAFATMINTGSAAATGCRIEPATALPAGFTYQTTDPATNTVTSSPNTPVAIAAGQSQSFVIAVTPSVPIPSTDVALSFGCANAAPAPVNPGLNTLLLSASATPVPDVVALATTVSDDGIVTLSGSPATGAFAVATVNLGAAATITATAEVEPAALAARATICGTDAGGQCLSAPGPSVTTAIDAGATPTFGVFLTGTGPVLFDPANARVFVRFRDESGAIRGATSVAVRTP